MPRRIAAPVVPTPAPALPAGRLTIGIDVAKTRLDVAVVTDAAAPGAAPVRWAVANDPAGIAALTT